MLPSKTTASSRSKPTVDPLDALGNAVRRAILQRLRAGPQPVAEIADAFPVSRPAISRHLQMLKDAGLVETKRTGTQNVYAVRLQGFASVRAFLDEFWDVALTKLEALAADEPQLPATRPMPRPKSRKSKRAK